MTNDTGQRLRDHKRTKLWWPEVYRQTIDEASTRADAFFMEAAAILKEKPAYNLDIPSFDRYDVLKSRSTVADAMTTEDRIAALEHQLREARRELPAGGSVAGTGGLSGRSGPSGGRECGFEGIGGRSYCWAPQLRGEPVGDH